MALPSQPEHSHGYTPHKPDLMARLKRIEGQVRGLQRMLEEDRYCIDVLTQLAAVRAALNRVGLTLLESHTRSCVASAVRRGDGEGDVKMDELMDVIERFVK